MLRATHLETPDVLFSMRAANLFTKSRTDTGISSGRIDPVIQVSSELLVGAMCGRSWFVANTTRTSPRMVRVLPSDTRRGADQFGSRGIDAGRVLPQSSLPI